MKLNLEIQQVVNFPQFFQIALTVYGHSNGLYTSEVRGERSYVN